MVEILGAPSRSLSPRSSSFGDLLPTARAARRVRGHDDDATLCAPFNAAARSH